MVSARNEYREARVELLVVSLAVTLDTIRDRDGSAATDEVMNLLHQENFNVLVVKKMIKTRGDCQVVTQDAIDQ